MIGYEAGQQLLVGVSSLVILFAVNAQKTAISRIAAHAALHEGTITGCLLP